ncbi:MAG: nucleotide exchange factor GrpE [Ruminococcaceae bacterium]|nr:nucleotide exchange factor GrpE [Oscillospiraceae bacterium]
MTDDKVKETEAEKTEKWEEILTEDAPAEAKDEPAKKDKKTDKTLKDENKKLTASLKEAESALEKAKSELAEVNDKYLRTAAEYDNFRRRSAKEKEGIYADAYADALSAILPILDNLERAAAYSDGAQLTDGIKLIFKSAKESLDKLGVNEFGAPGDKFDPQIHNAMMHIDDEAFGENEITEVFQKGYKKGDKILREALVKVAN